MKINSIKPFPHQEDAIRAVITALSKADRAHMVMACGTGKTITSLWIAERLKPKSMIVFVPSLALINQFMKEWIANIGWKDYKTLAVCSDDSVTSNLESESILFEAINFPVSDNSKEIKKFINSQDSSIKIIFCTYQSSYLLKGLSIDFGLFDEAHRTAGFGKDLFSFALNDKNIKIKKRLFMTATPRHASVSKKKQQENTVVYSMDSESIYGERAYTLGFREAINLDLICDYRIIVSIAKKTEDSHINEDANAKALREAINRTGATKIITYHKSIREAESFSKSKINLKYEQLHVNGSMPIDERTRVMQIFRNSNKTIICNARCLTEGVDVPAIDMVAFLSPKSSKIDIVQAIGRALRKSPHKSIGYIFLPVYIDGSIDNPRDAIAESDFSHIWEVLNAISEQDADLNDVIRALSRGAGKAGMPEDKRLNRFLDFSLIDNNDFIDSIGVKILDKICNHWDVMYERLIAYKEHYGHSNVPEGDKENRTLHHWVVKQRTIFRKNMLSHKYIEKLNKIDLDWDPIETAWQSNFNRLKDYYSTNKANKMRSKTNKIRIEDSQLKKWCETQRRSYHFRKAMPTNREELLRSIGFDFGQKYMTVKEVFNQKLQDLIEYGKITGNINLKNSDKNRRLVGWLQSQRSNFLNNRLSKQKIDILEKAGIILDVWAYFWNQKYEECLKALKDKKQKSALKVWVRLQLDRKRDGKLSKEYWDKIKKLLDDGFNASIKKDGALDKRFVRYLYELKNLKNKKGNFNVTSSDGVNLYNFVNRKRLQNTRGTINKHAKEALNKIGFEWENKVDHKFNLWLKTFNEFKKYQKHIVNRKHKKCYIPGKIINFRISMRFNKKKGTLDEKRLKLLNEIGFDFGE